MCDNCVRAIHEIEVQMGSWKLDLGKIKQILSHDEED